MRNHLVSKGVHCYNNKNNVVYCGGGYVGIHSVDEGEIEISLPNKYRVKALLGTSFQEQEIDIISLYMKKHDTVLFELI